MTRLLSVVLILLCADLGYGRMVYPLWVAVVPQIDTPQ